jgi:membrane fusion protein (multidrug efflux system)
MIGVPVLAGIGGAYYYIATARYQQTDDAYLRAAQVTISSNVGGRVSEVDVRDNQLVHVGETLFKLDDRPFRIAVEEAEARLASARLEVEALKATYRQRQAELRTAQSALDYAQREYDRQTRLVGSGIASQAQVDRALAARNESQGRVASAQQEITSTLASLGGDPNIPANSHPTVLRAQAELDRAQLDLSYTVITAPIEGVVTRVEQLQTGNYIKEAGPAFALVSTHDVWVEANYKEVQLTHMQVGQEAMVKLDAYPEHALRARVSSVSPGTGSEFSVLPAENASGNWVKVVQRLPVRLELVDPAPAARSGLSAVVTVDTKSLVGKPLQTAGAATGR